MIADKKFFFIGAGLMAGFLAVLVIIFSPVFNGITGLEYLDSLYNSISKGSAYYIPKVTKEVEKYAGKSITVSLAVEDEKQADQIALLFMKSGALVNVTGSRLTITGDLGSILKSSLKDADSMYVNDGGLVKERYDYDERRVLYNWWYAFKKMDKDLKNQKMFGEAKIVSQVVQKAIETSYNYYGIEPQKISGQIKVVSFSLVFYVIYTLWYGFSIMYLFEGWGLRFEE